MRLKCASNVPQMRLKCALRKDHILTTFWPHYDHILTTFWPHFCQIFMPEKKTTFWPHYDHILTTFSWAPNETEMSPKWAWKIKWPHFDHINVVKMWSFFQISTFFLSPKWAGNELEMSPKISHWAGLENLPLVMPTWKVWLSEEHYGKVECWLGEWMLYSPGSSILQGYCTQNVNTWHSPDIPLTVIYLPMTTTTFPLQSLIEYSTFNWQ